MKRRHFLWAWDGDELRRDATMTSERAAHLIREWRRMSAYTVRRDGRRGCVVTHQATGTSARMRWMGGDNV